jgi:hypothetical protein
MSNTMNAIIWPNFFIVGAAKAGTTSLYHYLKEIPGVYMSSVKEPYYFSPHFVQRYPGDVVTDKEEYLRLFEKARGYIAVGEASPSYLWDPDSPKLIHQAVPNARIIILLRDPIERAYSHYLFAKKYGTDNKKLSSFYHYLMRDYKSQEKADGISKLYIEFSMYYEQVKRYFDEFGRQQVKVIVYEDFIQQPEETVNDVLAFLGVNYTVTAITKQHNPYSVPRSPLSLQVYSLFRWLRARGINTSKLTISLPNSLTAFLEEKLLFKKIQKPKIEPEAFRFLQDIYHDDALKLESLLGQSLPWPTISRSSSQIMKRE